MLNTNQQKLTPTLIFQNRYLTGPVPESDEHNCVDHLCSLKVQPKYEMYCLHSVKVDELQRLDPKLIPLINWLENPDPSRKPAQIDHFMLRKNTLYRAGYDEFGQLWRLVIPKSHVKEVMKEIHDYEGADLGFFKTWHLIKSRFYWPGMYRNVLQFTKSCQICQEYNRATTVPSGHLFPSFPPLMPFHTAGIDFIGPFPLCIKHKYALVFICHTTRFLGAFSTSNCDSESAIKVLERELILVHSCRKRIVLDQGTHFNFKTFTEFAEKYGIELVFGPAYHHQFNGVVERANEAIKSTLSKAILGKHKLWATFLKRVFAINITVNATTQESPFCLIFSRGPNLSIDNILPISLMYL